MTKFKTSALHKRKLIDMIKGLYPKAKSVWITKSGMVYIRKGFMSWIRIHVSELYLSVLPVKLKQLSLVVNDKAYDSVYNPYSYVIVDMLNSGASPNDIVDYLYKQYSLLKYNIQRSTILNPIEIPAVAVSIPTNNSTLPVVSPISTVFLSPLFYTLLKDLRPTEETIFSEIKKLVNRIKIRFRKKRSRKYTTQLRALLQVNLK